MSGPRNTTCSPSISQRDGWMNGWTDRQGDGQIRFDWIGLDWTNQIRFDWIGLDDGQRGDREGDDEEMMQKVAFANGDGMQ